MQFTKSIENEQLSPFFLEPLLAARLSEVNTLLEEKQKTLRNAPAGSLRISRSGKTTQFYQITKSGDTHGKYIPAKNDKLVKALAQKDYDKKLIATLKKELKFLQKTLRAYKRLLKSAPPAAQIFKKLHKLRRPLVTPACLPAEDFAELWQNVQYSPKPFSENAPELYTSRGERVRSKSEIIIADTLHRLNIPYRYEFPLNITTEKDERHTFHPDFICLNLRTRQEFFWEHFGMMDDAEYASSAAQKLRLYEKNGIFPGKNLIISMETSASPINSKQVEKTAKQYLA